MHWEALKGIYNVVLRQVCVQPARLSIAVDILFMVVI